MRFFRALLALPFVPIAFVEPVFAQSSYSDIERCNRAIPVKVPAFSCSDGVVVPKVIDAAGHCEYPEDLNGRCVENSRLGRLPSSDPNVEMVFSCRNIKDGPIDTSAPVTYRDIAVIQHDKKTGATCFYQHMANTDGENIISPTDDVNLDFWDFSVNSCSSCHSNGAFVRTPHYWNVFDENGKHVLPPKPTFSDPQPYSIVNRTGYQVALVSKEENACTSCHTIGAYRSSAGASWQLGNVNKLASGQWKSVSGPGGRAPTMDGYDDFMAKHVQGGRPAAIKAVQELEGCLKKPIPAGCKLTQTFTEPFARKGGKGGVRFQVRNFNMMGQGMDAALPMLAAPIPTIAIATIEYNHQCSSCGSSINQIIIGFEGAEKASACIYSGPGNSGGWKTAVVDLSQPFGSVMDKRDIRVRYAQALNCKDALSWWKVDAPNGPDANHSIGSLSIQF